MKRLLGACLALALLLPGGNAEGQKPARMDETGWLDATKAPGALFDDDSGTFVHVVWRGGQLVDLAGNTWTKVGSPTQVAATSLTPAGARAFVGASTRYDLASTISGSIWAGFIGCAAVTPVAGDIATTTMVAAFAQNADSSALYQLVANETGALRFFGGGSTADAQLVPGVVNVICFGVDTSIGRAWLKANMRPIVVGIGSTAVTVTNMKIGSHWDNALGLGGTVHELWLSTSLPGGTGGAWFGPEPVDNAFAAISRRAYQRLMRDIPASARPAYRASVTIDSASATVHEIVVTNGTAFAIEAPSGAVAGRGLTIKVKNTSGGALGTATWNAVYKMVAWTQPADGYSRSVDFVYDGTNWVETNRSAADVPN